MNKRITQWSSLKGALMIVVVMGHFCQLYAYRNAEGYLIASLFCLIYTVYDLPSCPISDSLSCPKSGRFSVRRCDYAPRACAPGSVISLLTDQAPLMRKRLQLHFHS